MTAARRARQKARKLHDSDSRLFLMSPAENPDVTVQAGLASAAASAGPEQENKD